MEYCLITREAGPKLSSSGQKAEIGFALTLLSQHDSILLCSMLTVFMRLWKKILWVANALKLLYEYKILLLLNLFLPLIPFTFLWKYTVKIFCLILNLVGVCLLMFSYAVVNDFFNKRTENKQICFITR